MEDLTKTIIEMATTYGGKILLAIVVLIVGRIIIGRLNHVAAKAIDKTSLDPTVNSLFKKFINILLYVILILSIIQILGVPMSSVIAVLASCGLAIGLALQGALSNVAGGVMILITKPFKVGDFVDAAGGTGVVKDINLLYTTIITTDNKRITVPNGSLMNAVVTNYSSEETRRVDINYKITNDIDCEVVKKILIDAEASAEGVLADPAPFARLVDVDDDTYIFQTRAWCESSKYWDTYFNVIEACSKALRENGIEDPENRIAIRMVKED